MNIQDRSGTYFAEVIERDGYKHVSIKFKIRIKQPKRILVLLNECLMAVSHTYHMTRNLTDKEVEKWHREVVNTSKAITGYDYVP